MEHFFHPPTPHVSSRYKITFLTSLSGSKPITWNSTLIKTALICWLEVFAGPYSQNRTSDISKHITLTAQLLDPAYWLFFFCCTKSHISLSYFQTLLVGHCMCYYVLCGSFKIWCLYLAWLLLTSCSSKNQIQNSCLCLPWINRLWTSYIPTLFLPQRTNFFIHYHYFWLVILQYWKLT